METTEVHEIFAPCCHTNVCSPCASKLDKCPTCRSGTRTGVVTQPPSLSIWSTSHIVLQPVVAILMAPLDRGATGRTGSSAVTLAVELAKFFTLKAAVGDFDGSKLSPSPLVDEAWRLAMLRPAWYARTFCRAFSSSPDLIFDYVLPVDKVGLPSRCLGTEAAYRATFPDVSKEVARCWEPLDVKPEPEPKPEPKPEPPSSTGLSLNIVQDRHGFTCEFESNTIPVLELKEAIRVHTGIHPDNQVVQHAGIELSDRRRTGDYGMSSGDAVFLTEMVHWIVFVTVLPEPVLPEAHQPVMRLRFPKSATVADLKIKLGGEYGIPKRASAAAVLYRYPVGELPNSHRAADPCRENNELFLTLTRPM